MDIEFADLCLTMIFSLSTGIMLLGVIKENWKKSNKRSK